MQNAARIQALKDAGYRVRVSHLRTIEGGAEGNDLLLSKHVLLVNGKRPGQRGGMTVVEVGDEHGPVDRGVARCNEADPFNRRLGLTIALNRLEKRLA